MHIISIYNQIYSISLSKIYYNPIYLVIFVFFLTLHADQLSFTLFQYNIRINNLIALLLAFCIFLQWGKKIIVFPKYIYIGFACLTFSLLFSSLLSSVPKRTFYFFVLYFQTFFFYFLCPYLIIQLLDIGKVFYLYVLSFLVVGLYALAQLFLSSLGILDSFSQQHITENVIRPNAFAYEPSFYALYMTPAVFLVNLLYLADQKMKYFFKKKIKIGYLLLLNFLFLISTSTAAFLTYFIFITVSLVAIIFFKEFVFLCRKFFKFTVLILLSAIIFLALFPSFAQHFFFKFFYVGLKHGSFLERWTGIVNCWHVFLENPFFGVGIGAIGHHLQEWWLSRSSWN